MSRFSNILLSSSSSAPTKAQEAAYLHASDIIMCVTKDINSIASTSTIRCEDLLGTQNFQLGFNHDGTQKPDVVGTAGTDARIKFVGTQDFMKVADNGQQNSSYLQSMHKAGGAWTFVVALKLASVTERQGLFLTNLIRWSIGSTYKHGVEIIFTPNTSVEVGVGNGSDFATTVSGAIHSTVGDTVFFGVSVDIDTRAVTVRSGSNKYTGSLPAFTPSSTNGGYGGIFGAGSKVGNQLEDLSTNTEVHLFGIIDKVVSDSEWTSIVSNAESLTGVTFDNV